MATQASPVMTFKVQKPLFPPHTKTGKVWLVYAEGKKYMSMITEDQIPQTLKDHFLENPDVMKVYSRGRVVDETLDINIVNGRLRYEHIELHHDQDPGW